MSTIPVNAMGLLYTPNEQSKPDWIADFGGREHVMPFPAKLDYTTFSDDGADKVVTSGAVNAVTQNEVYTLAIDATGGTYTVTVTTPTGTGGANVVATSPAIPYNTSPNPLQRTVGYQGALIPPGSVQEVLEALSNVGTGNVKVNGNVGNYGGGMQIYLLTVTFTGSLGGKVCIVSTTATGLTGSGKSAVANKLIDATTGAGTGETFMSVLPLVGIVYAGTALKFDNGVYVTVAKTTLRGETSIQVLENDFAIPSGAIALQPRIRGHRTVSSGRLCGRTFSERSQNLPFRKWQAGDDESYLLYFTVWDAVKHNDCEFYRPGSVVIENFLPDYLTLDTLQLTEIRRRYQCITRLNNAVL